MSQLRLFFALVLLPALHAQEFDVVLRGGTVVDGTGAPGYRANVAIKGKRIAAISRGKLKGQKNMDVSGLVVAPGFIDMHAHIDPIERLPEARSMVSQGVTTAIGGPDGSAPWPLAPYLDKLERTGVGLNVAMLVGHNSIRRGVMALENREPTEKELKQMKANIAQAMDDGAWGISTGLKYLPGSFAKTDEVIELSKVAAERGGYYTSHLREEGLGLLGSVKEAIAIGRQARIPIVLTHHKVIGQPMWGSSTKTLAMVDAARNEGIDVMMDQYPYTATYTGITVLVPAWAREGGTKKFLQRLKNPELRARIKKDIVFNIVNDRGGGDLRRVQFGLVKWNRELEGKTLHDWATLKGLKPTAETGAELVMEAIQNGGASCIYHVLSEEDVERIMGHPLTMAGSDGRLTEPGSGHPHPRWYGAFPRILGHYVREKKVLKLEDAIRKMTSLTASRVGLKDRGAIKIGFHADLVVFDPDTVIDKATFTDPHQYPVGIKHVFVNGVAAIANGEFQKRRAGMILRKSDHSSSQTFPGEEWESWDNPEQGGWSSPKLKQAENFADTLKTSAVMIIHGGKIVAKWGETKRPLKCHSMRKSILSALYGPYALDGTIKLSATLKDIGIDDNKPSLTTIEKTAKISDLIKARSGIYHPALYETKAMAAKRPKRGSHKPGTFWYYNNWDFNALGTIFERQSGKKIFEEFERRLAKPLGMQDFIRDQHTSYFTGTNSIHPAYPFQLSARDLARFGLLFARGGRWNDRQIIPHGWVMESTRSYSTTERGGGYGYMWWVGKNGKFYPNVQLPDGSFAAHGYRGHKVLVVPQWDLVVVHRVDTFKREGSVGSGDFGQFMKYVIDASPYAERQSAKNFPSVDELPDQPGLPDPFKRDDGSRVSDPKDWPEQREWLKQRLAHYMYGQMPPRPSADQVTIMRTDSQPQFEGKAVEERFTLTIRRNGRSADLRFALIRPDKNERQPTIIKNCRALFDLANAGKKYEPTVERDLAAARDAVKRGYVLCKFRREDFAPDQKNNRGRGIFPLYPDYDWGSIAVWAWTHQVVLDALDRLGYADLDRIVATGHSRGGQTAIAAGIFDERIDVVVPCTGGYGSCATLRIRDPKGVRGTMDYIAHLKKHVPHWFGGRYYEFVGRQNKLPFDSHTLVAMIAPRPLLNTNATEDEYNNTLAVEAGMRAGSIVYDWLGRAGWARLHWRPGKHAQQAEDWTALLDFSDEVFKGRKSQSRFDRWQFPDYRPPLKWSRP